MTSAAQGPARAEFTRDEMIDGLRDLVSRLRGTGQPSRIQIVGGAAIALTLNEHRSATADIDGPVSPPEVVLAVAGTIAAERNWRDDWLNDAAAQKRGRRELEDLEVLVPAVGLTTVDEVEDLYESFYPGDELTERTARIIQAVLELHVSKPSAPSLPDLGQ
jgi:hypothetical protein